MVTPVWVEMRIIPIAQLSRGVRLYNGHSLCNLKARNFLVASRWCIKTNIKQTCRLILLKPISLHRSYGFQRCYAMRREHRCVRMYVTKCHREWTARPRSINLGKHRQFHKVSLYANFHPNHQRSWPNFQGKWFESRTLRCSYVNISQTMTDVINVIISNKKLYMAFRLAYFDLILAYCEG